MTLVDVRQQAIVGKLLQQQRKLAGLTQIDVANRLGTPQSFVSKYESSERTLDLIEIRKICVALGTTLTAFASAVERELSAGERQ